MALSKLTDIRKSLSVEVEDLQVNGITTFTGSVSIGGTLTYQDVTNVDSVGIITAQAGINVSGGTGTFAGDVLIADKIVHTGDTDTAIRFHANDTVSVETGGSQQVTIGSNVNIISGELVIPDTIRHRSDANTKIRFPANDTFSVETAGSERLRITAAGNVMVGNGADTPYAPLHVYAENGRGLNAIFGKGFVDSANYHYDDANIQLN